MNTRKKHGQTNRWQDKRFHLDDWYKYAIRQMIDQHRTLPPVAKWICHVIASKFYDKPWFPMNLDELARECGVTRRTLYKHRPAIEKAFFRFQVPPYWARKENLEATKIWFPTQKVTKWLRNRGLLNAKPDWVSRNDKPDVPLRNTDEMGVSSEPWVNISRDEGGNADGSKANSPTTGNKTRIDLKREAGAKTAAPSLEARDASGAPAKKNSHEGIGADYSWYDEDDEKHDDWFEASTEHIDGIPNELVVGARIKWEGYTGIIAGHGFALPDQTDDARNVLVLWDETIEDGETLAEYLGWLLADKYIVVTESAPCQERPVASPISFQVGAKVEATRPGLFFGVATVVGIDGDVVVTPDCAPRVRMPVHPRDLRQVAPAPKPKPLPTVAEAIEARGNVTGARVSHLKFGPGKITSHDGKTAEVDDDGAHTSVLLAFLQIVDNELAGDILASAAKVRTEQMTG